MLAARGYRVVATDINEIALSYSRQRSKKFRDQHPVYYAADAAHLPFNDGVFGSVTAFEMLHHLEELGPALSEIYRVLKPGGKLFTYEPYALNPYRRLAELRYYLLRGIERSFTVRSLTRELEDAGLRLLTCTRHVPPTL